MITTFVQFAASALLVSAFAPGQAATLYDNLAASQDGADPVYSYGPLANSFSTGATAVRLDGVQLLLDNLSTAYAGNVQVGLFSDAGTAPGSLIASLGTLSYASVSTAGAASYAFTPGTAVALAAGTRYWVEIAGSSANALQWSWTGDLASTGVAGQYTWSQELGTNANSAAFGPYQMAIGVSAVPEPATLLLSAAGLGVVWVKRRRRIA